MKIDKDNLKAKDPEFLSPLERGLQVMSVFGREQQEMSPLQRI